MYPSGSFTQSARGDTSIATTGGQFYCNTTHFPSSPPSRHNPLMSLTLPRILSLLLGLAEAVTSTIIYFNTLKPPVAAVHSSIAFLFIAFLVALIWFPDEIGSPANHPIGRYGISTPPVLVSLTGWLLLLALPLWYLYISSH